MKKDFRVVRIAGVVALVFAAAVTVGCAKDQPAEAEGAGVKAPAIEAKIQTGPESWAEAPAGADGKLPSEVAREYLEARKKGDLRAVWEHIVSDERLEFETWRREYVDPNEKVVSFEVGEGRSGAPGTAAVQVSFEYDISGRKVTGEDEWWQLRADSDGTWKLTLLPRQ